MTAFIFINGDLSNTSTLPSFIKSEDTIICADGGTEHAVNLGIVPDVVIGDMDSISTKTKEKLSSGKTEWISYPKEKDFTDSELAIKYAIDRKFEEIIIVGILGNRLDHFLANIFHIAELTKNHRNIRIIEGNQHIYFVYEKITLQGKKNDQLSLISMHTDCIGITTENLEYKLQNETLPLGSTRGISNVFTEENISVHIKKGILIAIHSHQ